MTMEVEINQTLDASGLTCPLPLLKAKQALNKLASGEVLSVISTDPGSVRDFKVFCDQSGHQLLLSEAGAANFHYLLRKS
ncbi:MAG: TusA-related sulfurtransferase [Candidatus Azotimanducaceae bacterium]|jgi:tRNA 2-thiouridine synthesizing protein A